MNIQKVNFCTPVKYETDPSFFSVKGLRTWVDDYFNLTNNKIAVIPDGFTTYAQIHTNTGQIEWVKCAIKVASYFTLVIPLLVFIAKCFLRSSPFYILPQTPLKDDSSELRNRFTNEQNQSKISITSFPAELLQIFMQYVGEPDKTALVCCNWAQNSYKSFKSLLLDYFSNSEIRSLIKNLMSENDIFENLVPFYAVMAPFRPQIDEKEHEYESRIFSYIKTLAIPQTKIVLQAICPLFSGFLNYSYPGSKHLEPLSRIKIKLSAFNIKRMIPLRGFLEIFPPIANVIPFTHAALCYVDTDMPRFITLLMEHHPTLFSSKAPPAVIHFLQTWINDAFVFNCLKYAYECYDRRPYVPDISSKRPLRFFSFPKEMLLTTVYNSLYPKYNWATKTYDNKFDHTITEIWISDVIGNHTLSKDAFLALEPAVQKMLHLMAKYFQSHESLHSIEKALSKKIEKSNHFNPLFWEAVASYVGEPHNTSSVCREWQNFTRMSFKPFCIAHFKNKKIMQIIVKRFDKSVIYKENSAQIFPKKGSLENEQAYAERLIQVVDQQEWFDMPKILSWITQLVKYEIKNSNQAALANYPITPFNLKYLPL